MVVVALMFSLLGIGVIVAILLIKVKALCFEMSYTFKNIGAMMTELLFGDSLEQMDILIERGEKFHLIFADIPYGTTACKWDVIIPFSYHIKQGSKALDKEDFLLEEKMHGTKYECALKKWELNKKEGMWEKIEKLSYPNTAVLLCGQQPFSSALIMSNIKNFKYQWVYQKTSPSGGLNSKHRPMRAHEDVLLFSKKKCTYNPQKTTGHKRKTSTAHHKRNSTKTDAYGEHGSVSYDSTERYPLSVQVFSSDVQKLSLHTTQKPVALGRYMVKTYMNKGEKMLDFTCGSGSFVVAAKLEGMDAVGIDDGYCLKDKMFNGLQMKGRKWTEITQLRLDGTI